MLSMTCGTRNCPSQSLSPSSRASNLRLRIQRSICRRLQNRRLPVLRQSRQPRAQKTRRHRLLLMILGPTGAACKRITTLKIRQQQNNLPIRQAIPVRRLKARSTLMPLPSLLSRAKRVCHCGNILITRKHSVYMYPTDSSIKSAKRKSSVVRRYSDFAWLLECLLKKYPFRQVPLLPPKRLAGMTLSGMLAI